MALKHSKSKKKKSDESFGEGKKEKLVDIITHEQRETRKLISSFLLTAGKNASTKTPTQLSHFSPFEL